MRSLCFKDVQGPHKLLVSLLVAMFLSSVSEIKHPLESLRKKYMPFNMSDCQSYFTSMILRASGLAVLIAPQIGETIFIPAGVCWDIETFRSQTWDLCS